MTPLAASYEELISRMKCCYQFKDMDMVEHGQSVHKTYLALRNQLEGGEKIADLPEWMYSYNWPNADLEKYHVLHDCGKPLVKVVDDNGKQHFPSHAKASYQQYVYLFPDDLETAFLIRADMIFHTWKFKYLKDSGLGTGRLGKLLYLTAWAEIIANCEMFGGQESTSFKIKKKRLIKLGKLFNTT